MCSERSFPENRRKSGREPLPIHPQDAAARGLRDGDVVRVFNARGACPAGLVVSDGVRPGVIQPAAGAGSDPQQTGEGAGMDKHGNPDILTIDKGTSKMAQGPIAHTALVEVKIFMGQLPPISVHQAPATDR
jgi:biotin/methionine sulfoxide reductase